MNLRAFSLGAAASYAAVMLLSASIDPARLCSFLVGCLCVFVFLPVVMSAAMTAAGAFLAVLILAIAAFGRVVQPRRRSGVGGLLGDLVGCGAHVVPGYWVTLRAAGSPQLWGIVLGLAAATVTLAVRVVAAT